MKTKIMLLVMMLLGLLMIPCIASAQASKEGLDLRISFSYLHTYYDYHIIDPKMSYREILNSDMDGYGGSVSIGYKWHHVGLYIDQELYGARLYDDCWCSGYQVIEGGHFLGGTYLVARVSPPTTEFIELDLGVGFGAMYSNGDDFQPRGPHPIIFNDDGKASAAFSFKGSASITAYILDNFGVGVVFDYTVGLNKIKYKEEDNNIIRMNELYSCPETGISCSV